MKIEKVFTNKTDNRFWANQDSDRSKLELIYGKTRFG